MRNDLYARNKFKKGAITLFIPGLHSWLLLLESDGIEGRYIKGKIVNVNRDSLEYLCYYGSDSLRLATGTEEARIFRSCQTAVYLIDAGARAREVMKGGRVYLQDSQARLPRRRINLGYIFMESWIFGLLSRRSC
jgi:hypothetical protein